MNTKRPKLVKISSSLYYDLIHYFFGGGGDVELVGRIKQELQGSKIYNVELRNDKGEQENE